MPDPSLDAVTQHQAELECFTTELIRNGFHPLSGDRRRWVGPIHKELAKLTAATDMRLELRDGWPYRHPYLYVRGLQGRRHVSGKDNVCLWDDSDDSYEWLSWTGIERRISAWCSAQHDVTNEPTLDSHLYFEPYDARFLVLLNLEAMIGSGGSSGTTKGRRDAGLYRIDGKGDINVAWFRIGRISAPPTEWQALVDMLSEPQRGDLGRFTRWATARHPALIILLWDQVGTTGALALQISPQRGSAVALEIALTDRSIMQLRTGPDGAVLHDKRVLLFGAGAIGSHIAVVLAKSGVHSLLIVDEQRLRPGDVTRHAASGRYVGLGKGEAVAHTLRDWQVSTPVEALSGSIWEPEILRTFVERHDLVVDATGSPTYTDLLSEVTREIPPLCPLLAVALYRGGRVARARVQSRGTAPIVERRPPAFPDIPEEPGNETSTLSWEPGCGAPVNNAPPWAVVAATALCGRLSGAMLGGRLIDDVDVVEVYQALEVSPFDRAGEVVFPANSVV